MVHSVISTPGIMVNIGQDSRDIVEQIHTNSIIRPPTTALWQMLESDQKNKAKVRLKLIIPLKLEVESKI